MLRRGGAVELEKHPIYWASFAQQRQKRLFGRFMRFFGHLAANTGQNELQGDNVPVILPRVVEKPGDGTLAAASPEQRVSCERGSLETLQIQTLGSEGVHSNKIAANCNAHRGILPLGLSRKQRNFHLSPLIF